MHIMLDTETLGNQPTSVITQIAMVPFNIYTGETDIETFNRYIDIDSGLKAGCTIDGSTIEWWMNQSQEAQKAVFVTPSKISLSRAIHETVDYLQEQISAEGLYSTYLWCHATFDYPILKHAAACVNKEIPIHFRCVRDLRTIVHLADIDVGEYIKKSPLLAHDALEDCKFQIAYTVDAWRKLKNGRDPFLPA